MGGRVRNGMKGGGRGAAQSLDPPHYPKYWQQRAGIRRLKHSQDKAAARSVSGRRRKDKHPTPNHALALT